MANSDKYIQLTAKDLHQRMDDEKAFYLIDTLPNDHFRRAHLPNSKNACSRIKRIEIMGIN